MTKETKEGLLISVVLLSVFSLFTLLMYGMYLGEKNRVDNRKKAGWKILAETEGGYKIWRLDVEGGYLYQIGEGEIVFIPAGK